MAPRSAIRRSFQWTTEQVLKRARIGAYISTGAGAGAGTDRRKVSATPTPEEEEERVMTAPGAAFDDEGSEMEASTSGMLVAVRLRPVTANEQKQGNRSCCRVVGDQVVVIEKFGVPNGHLRSQQSSEKEYAYDIAFGDDSTQEDVYTKTVKDTIPTVLNGYNTTVFAYGATGAGKTHTMMGSERDGVGELEDMDEDDLQVDGIIPHALADIFTIIRHRKKEEAILNLSNGSTFEWRVLVSYLEVYNEQIRDLLKPSQRPLSLREDPARGVVRVAGLHHEEATTVGQVLQLLRRGNRNRKTEPTAANQVSSRSHAVIQVTVRHTTTTMLSEMNPRKSTVEGTLSLIDLAGSERASSTQNKGLRLTEGANINKSLLALANCINSLSSQRGRSASFDSAEASKRLSQTRTPRAKVQYRDSKLTHLLKNSLEGECRLVMIANINPSHTSFDESHNTLKYANRAKNIKIRPKMNVVTAEMTYQQRIEKLEKENIQLRQALASAKAELEKHSAVKRKSFQLRDTISPGTLKKFKNFSWSDTSVASPVHQDRCDTRDQEDKAALLATIEQLRGNKAKLEEKVLDLENDREVMQARMVKADTLLKTAIDPMLQEMAPLYSGANVQERRVPVPAPDLRSTPVVPAPVSRPQSTVSVPAYTPRLPPLSSVPTSSRIPVSAPVKGPQREHIPTTAKSGVIPRSFPRTSRESLVNRTATANVQQQPRSVGFARRVSCVGTADSRLSSPSSISRLKRPVQYRRSSLPGAI